MTEIIKFDSDCPVIPFISGDGIGPEIWEASKEVFDKAVKVAFNGEKKVDFQEILAGEKSFKENNTWLPDESLEKIKESKIAIKGPLTTPVGKGMRSLNVRIRQELDLYACIRPVKYYPPVPSPVKHPEKVDITVFRENTEDLYAGIEWDACSDEAKKLTKFINQELGASLKENSSIGIKPISSHGTKRLVSRAIKYALDNSLKSVTLMHKGNIMKFTEGGFRKWGYEIAQEKYEDKVITEDEFYGKYNSNMPEGKVLIKDRIADMVFAEVLLKPENFDVIATTNLNGDYISDALAAQVGGLGIAPGANIGDDCAVFEATHGTAPDIAGKGLANPCSLILSGAMMFDYMGWNSVADKIRAGVSKALKSGNLTHDLASQIQGANQVKCSDFGRIIADLIS
ncbi:MAG: NADP-dependent isocitrate dehydrogenase [Desulfobacteraceae bacterium]|nr:NADP-dependent isocitrate dehydrogenase [Desulfobacteraceae bacterium]